MVLLTAVLSPAASAAERPLTTEELQALEETNEKIEAYIASVGPRMGASNILSVPCYQQETKYYCGVACTQMLMAYRTGTKYSQDYLAEKTGTTTSGSGSYGIQAYLASQGMNYQVATVNTVTTLSNDIIYSIDKDYPVICSVKQIPNRYTSTTGHFLLIYGYLYAASGSSGTSNIYYHDSHWNDDRFGSYTISLNDLKTAINSNSGLYIRYAG